jgi:hypothetical protein
LRERSTAQPTAAKTTAEMMRLDVTIAVVAVSDVELVFGGGAGAGV